jgi:hypothetical protein
MLIIHNEETTQIQNTLEEFSVIQNKLKFTVESEEERKLNFSDVIHTIQGNEIEFDIYRKPTTIDRLIHQISYHPLEHKIAGLEFLKNRMKIYPICNSNKQEEKD